MRSLLMRVPFEAKNIDINDTMREVFDFLSIQAASARNVALYLRPSPRTPAGEGDPAQLQQVIMNLILNSMDAMIAMPTGGG